MHSILFVAAVPVKANRYDPSAQKWSGFADHASHTLERYTNVERLSENIWLVNLAETPDPFGLLVHAALEFGIAYRLLALDDGPQWLPVAKDPTSIPARNG